MGKIDHFSEWLLLVYSWDFLGQVSIQKACANTASTLMRLCICEHTNECYHSDKKMNMGSVSCSQSLQSSSLECEAFNGTWLAPHLGSHSFQQQTDGRFLPRLSSLNGCLRHRLVVQSCSALSCKAKLQTWATAHRKDVAHHCGY